MKNVENVTVFKTTETAKWSSGSFCITQSTYHLKLYHCRVTHEDAINGIDDRMPMQRGDFAGETIYNILPII